MVTSTGTARKAPAATVQEVCIDLPGEAIQCWRSSDNIRVRLRKHRDVFFDINFENGAIYTVESASEFYSPRDKKLLRKVEFLDGSPFNIWVGREFRGSLVLKENGLLLGAFQVDQLDSKNYGADPKTKPEPLMVFMGKNNAASFACTASDPFGVGSTQGLLRTSFDPKLSVLKKFGTEFNYFFPPQSPEVREYVAVTEAMFSEIQPQVAKRLESGEAVEGNPGQIFIPPMPDEPISPLFIALTVAAKNISQNGVLNSGLFKETAGYVFENFKALNKIPMKVYIEKKAKGQYKVLFKGRPVTMLIAQARGIAENVKPLHQTVALGSKASAFIDGGFGKSGRSGYGGVKRLLLTSTHNFGNGMKIQVIGTVIDLFSDVNTVYFDEGGSKDLSEFLGRAGVSVAKAGVTAAIGSLFAAAGVAAMTAGAVAAGIGAAPVLAVVAVIVGGYILAAAIVDSADSEFSVKERAAIVAR